MNIDELALKFDALIPREDIKNSYEFYDGTYIASRISHTSSSILESITPVLAWPAITVDSRAERLDFLKWRCQDAETESFLADVYSANNLALESDAAHADALVTGSAFVVVGTGGAGEPNPLITVESPRSLAVSWSNRTRSVTEAVRFVAPTDTTQVSGVGGWMHEDGSMLVHYLPDRTVTYVRNGGVYQTVSEDVHNMGVVPVVPMFNRARPDTPGRGFSEITPALRYFTANGARTLMGMEVNREFYSYPLRYVLGAEIDDVTADRLKSLMSGTLVFERDDNGDMPQVGSFAANSPAPYLDQLRGLAQMASAAAAVPAHYFGVLHGNPTSADAIRAEESRLVRAVERHQIALGAAWARVGELAQRVAGREPQPVTCAWRDPATPTQAATADAVTKLSGVGILPPDSEVTLSRLGFDAQEQEIIRRERADKAATDILLGLTAPDAPAEDTGTP